MFSVICALAALLTIQPSFASTTQPVSNNSLPVEVESNLDDASDAERFENLNDTSIGDLILSSWQLHPRIKADLIAIEGSRLDLSASKVGYYPFVALDSAYDDNDDVVTQVVVAQPLFSGGATYYAVKESKTLSRISEVTLLATQLDLAIQTTNAFTAVNAAQDRLKSWQNYYDRLVLLGQAIDRRVEQGLAAEVDRDSVGIRIAQAEAGLTIAKAQLFEAKSSLNILTYKPISSLQWPSLDRISLEYENACTESTCLYELHPQVILANLESERIETVKKQRTAERFPTLALEYVRTIDGDDFNDDEDEQIRLNLSYRSDNDLRGYRIAKGEQQRTLSAQFQALNARKLINLEVINTQSRQKSTWLQYRAQSRAVIAALDQVESFIRQYRAGKKTWLEVLNAEREVQQAEITLTDIYQQFWNANIELRLRSMDWYSVLPEDTYITYLPKPTDNNVSAKTENDVSEEADENGGES